jgi:hypothetical protein
MKFRKRSDNYKVSMSKHNAIKELKGDERIAKIRVFRTGFGILTQPIMPKLTNKRNILFKDNYYLCPIGEYKIIITINNKKYLDIKIIRIPKWKANNYYQTPHITDYGEDICWGSIEDEIQQVCMKKDWYWAIKLSLALLEDGNYDTIFGAWHKTMIGLQIDYATHILKDVNLIKILKERFQRVEGCDYNNYYKIKEEHIVINDLSIRVKEEK